MKKKILIIGGSGFIGKAAAEFLVKKGYDVTATYYKSRKELIKNKNINFKPLDLKSKTFNKKIVFKNYDFIIFAGGYIDHSELKQGGIETFETHFLSLVKISQHIDFKKIKKFIYLGSGDQYEKCKSPVKENDANGSLPSTMYSLSKSLAENYLDFLHLNYGLQYVSLRLFLIYGPEQKKDRLIPYVISTLLQMKYVKK